MRIVIDLQPCQGLNQHRGIGRFSLSLAQAIARQPRKHELWLALNGLFPDSIDSIQRSFVDTGLVPRERIVTWQAISRAEGLNPANAWRRQADELIREQFLAALKPDIIHVSSLFEGYDSDVITSIKSITDAPATSVTLYDLIPWLHQDQYLADQRVKDWYSGKLNFLKKAELILAISEHSRLEAIQTLNLPEDTVVNISAGIDPIFQPIEITKDQEMALRQRYGLNKPFVMYTGGMDYRKNIKKLIEAFALLPQSLKSSFQLVIACGLEGNIQNYKRLVDIAQHVGLERDTLVLTDYIPEADLLALYNLCTLFVFPSLHEGFGLPVLEAMSCGAPTIGSNTTSIPELIQCEDALFDPHNPQSIANKMQEVLSDEKVLTKLHINGLEQAKRFSWNTTAQHALDAFELHYAKQNKVSQPSVTPLLKSPKPRLAFISPLPPERSGIADYSAELLPYLAHYYDIDLIVDQHKISDPWSLANLSFRPITYFDVHADQYDRVLYQFGNSTFHKHMFALLEKHPGVIVLHDFFLSGVQYWMQAFGYTTQAFSQALYSSHGYSALVETAQHGEIFGFSKYPCNWKTIQQAHGVIIHSQHAKDLGEYWYGSDIAANFCHIPLVQKPPDNQDRLTARQRLNLADDDFLVCSVGYISKTKQVDKLLEAWLSSPLVKDQQCKLALVGPDEKSDFSAALHQRIQNSGYQDRISMTGYLAPELYDTYLAAADAAIQLRTMSRGESSRTILNCLAYGIPTIVNAHGSMLELPSNSVIQLEDEFSNESLVNAVKKLKDDPVLRQQLSQNAVNYIRNCHNPELIAKQYYKAIELFSKKSHHNRKKQLIHALSNIDTTIQPSREDLLSANIVINANESFPAQRQLLLDVSGLIQDDPLSIHAIKNILIASLKVPPYGYRIEPVYTTQEFANEYRYARSFATRLLNLPSQDLIDEPIEIHKGDIFLGLDYLPELILKHLSQFKQWRTQGITIYFVVSDLPSKCLETIINNGDGALCTSKTIADQLADWIVNNMPQRTRRFNLGYLHTDSNSPDRSMTDLVLDKNWYKTIPHTLTTLDVIPDSIRLVIHTNNG